MPRKLRIFISSTMRDLANERQAVCQRLLDFNFEPVNAECWLPNGRQTWDLIRREIDTSDVFVLILGERYGWVPPSGSMSDKNLSVTHLEYLYAKEHTIPILPFLKRLDEETERDSEDAKKRDAFRREVKNWDTGLTVGTFDLAADLANAVGRATVEFLAQTALQANVAARAAEVDRRAPPSFEDGRQTLEESLPDELVGSARAGQTILFAGAGVSWPAGLPSATAFAELLARPIRENHPDYTVGAVGGTLPSVASDVVAYMGRPRLEAAIHQALNPPHGLRPTKAHLEAVRIFKLILTTNYDSLFEQAAEELQIDIPIIYDELAPSQRHLPSRAIVKLQGCSRMPGSLLITDQEVAMLDRTRCRLWEATVSALSNASVLVLGTSLRDMSVVRLFSEANVHGYYASPSPWLTEITKKRLEKWKLKCIVGSANAVLTDLSARLKN
jgi:hypothetical protein